MRPYLIVAALLVVVAWAAWATKPPEVTLGRHVQAIVGRAVLDVVQAALRAVATVLVALALLFAAWGYLAPRLTHAVSTGVHQAAAAAVPDPGAGLLDWLKHKEGSR